MNAASVDLKDRLVVKSVGTFAAASGWGIYIDSAPKEPDTVIVLLDVGGSEPQRSMSAVRTAATLDHDMVQVQVRSNSYTGAHEKMRGIIDAIEKGGIRWTVDGAESADPDIAIEGIFAMSSTSSLGRDDADRYVLSRNYRMVRREKL